MLVCFRPCLFPYWTSAKQSKSLLVVSSPADCSQVGSAGGVGSLTIQSLEQCVLRANGLVLWFWALLLNVNCPKLAKKLAAAGVLGLEPGKMDFNCLFPFLWHQLIVEQQDEQLELVSGSIGVLKNMSQRIGGELEEQAVWVVRCPYLQWSEGEPSHETLKAQQWIIWLVERKNNFIYSYSFYFVPQVSSTKEANLPDKIHNGGLGKAVT